MKYYLSLGSNLGQQKEFLNKALDRIKQLGSVTDCSKIYRSSAYGFPAQPDFMNLISILESVLSPFRLLRKLKQIECEIGRQRTWSWGPRTIDIDIVDYDGPELKEEILRIPHPDMRNRLFVLEPLEEVNPDYIDRKGIGIQVLIEKCKPASKI